MSIDSKETSKNKVENFNSDLEYLLKRFEPRKFSEYITKIIYKVNVNQEINDIYLHQYALVHSIEANCAYHRRYRDDEIKQNTLNRILNIYRKYEDPYLAFILKEDKNVHGFMSTLANQQGPWQERFNLYDLSRCLLLFVENDVLRNTSIEFRDNYGITLFEWVYMCFAVRSLTQALPSPVFSADNLFNTKILNFPKNAVLPFLSESSLSPHEIGEKYFSIRKEYPSYLHIHIKSMFLDFPLISFKNKEYLLVHPQIIINHATKGLHRICSNLNQTSFSAEFGKSFTNYIRRLVNEIPNIINILNEKEIQKASPGKSCDFLIELSDCILLIECKATQYNHDLFTENAIIEDTSTRSIREAFEQIAFTCMRITNSELDEVLDDIKKPIFGFCITYGSIQFANAPEYLDKFIFPNLCGKQPNLLEWISLLENTPQILSIRVFERFIMALIHQKVSPVSLIDSKLSVDYSKAGDWDAYIINEYGELINSWKLQFLEIETTKFTKRLLFP